MQVIFSFLKKKKDGCGPMEGEQKANFQMF